ncbi:hypothetical protein ACHAPT_008746 [Fusarium lateritium]
MASAAKDTWSANQYVKFVNERTQPSADLLSRVPTTSPKRVVDVGCGPGNSTAVLAKRYPDADVSGFDSSPDMIRKAKDTLPGVAFEVADLQTYKPEGPVDVLFSSAVFQWVPAGSRIQVLRQLLEHLAPGGSLAFQVPFNLSEPSHVSMKETAFAPNAPWVEKLKAANPVREEFPDPSELYDGLRHLCSDLTIWKTTYIHTMENHEGIVEWVKGTGLRPFLEPLSEPERQEYTKQYLERLRAAYPTQKDGKVLLPYPRLFVVATKA